MSSTEAEWVGGAGNAGQGLGRGHTGGLSADELCMGTVVRGQWHGAAEQAHRQPLCAAARAAAAGQGRPLPPVFCAAGGGLGGPSGREDRIGLER